MIRSSNKKAKVSIDDVKKGSTIHSGSFMTSYLHDDQTEFNNEMPIASPDALKFDELNEVPVNALKHEEEDDEEIEGSKNNEKSKKNCHMLEEDQQNNNAQQCESSSSNFVSKKSGENVVLIKDGKLVHESGYDKQTSTSTLRTISGGLTLNKTNESLKNLITYIKTAYSKNLTSPKWKNFKGLKLQVVEKIRLNNVIWRTWFEQCKWKYNIITR